MEELFRLLCIQSAAALLLIQTGGDGKLGIYMESNQQITTDYYEALRFNTLNHY
jgi:hypothetical protein